MVGVERVGRGLSGRRTRRQVAVGLALVAFATVGWYGVSTIGRFGDVDSGEHLAYAQYLDTHHRIPPKAVNYEYATPPLFQLVAVGAEHATAALPSVALELRWNTLTRAFWLALVAAGALTLTSRRRRVRIAGVVVLGVGVLWALDEAVSLAKSEPWSAGRLIALACGTGLILATGLIAREIWPENPGRAIAAGGFAAAYPVLYRMSILFHPEVVFAFECALAILVVLRASRTGWPARLGWVLGAAWGAAALTRQPGVLVIACLGSAALWLGRRQALGLLVRAAAVTIILAAPWWGYAYYRWHNPLQSNLAPRASLMMSSQPSSFLLGFPIEDLVVHPYEPDFSDDLLPKLHAELWSDWFAGTQNRRSTRLRKLTASMESVLGFVADALAIGGLTLLALPALAGVLRRRDAPRPDAGLAVLGLLALVSFAGFVTMLLRFPQQYDDPIKSSYLLFTAPCWAIFSVGAWSWIRAHHKRMNALLVAVASVYVVTYGADLVNALSYPSGLSVDNEPSFVDLQPIFQQTSADPTLGSEVDFLTSVANSGNQTAGQVVLTLRLARGMRLLGLPYYQRGSGCRQQGRLVTCPLDFLPGQSSTYIRYGLDVGNPLERTILAKVTSASPDSNPGNNTASFTITLAPG